MSEKIEYSMEFVVKASPKMLYKFLSTPSGLSEWFADNVNSRGKKFSFFWDDSEEVWRFGTNHFVLAEDWRELSLADYVNLSRALPDCTPEC